MSAQVEALKKELAAVQQDDTAKIKQIITGTTSASVSAMLAERLSAIGNPDAEIDGRNRLAKQKPKETRDDHRGGVGIPFIDRMISGQPEEE